MVIGHRHSCASRFAEASQMSEPLSPEERTQAGLLPPAQRCRSGISAASAQGNDRVGGSRSGFLTEGRHSPTLAGRRETRSQSTNGGEISFGVNTQGRR